jgi:uncharacterized protein YbcI
MMGDQHPTRSSELGEHAAQISREMVRLMRRTAGRGPTQARTTIGRDHVLVMFRDALTEGERNLIADGRDELVAPVRHAYQDVMSDEARAIVERELERRVIGFMSANSLEPDMAAEVFILEPGEEAGAGDVAAS